MLPHYEAGTRLREWASATAVAVARIWRVLTSLLMFLLLATGRSFNLSTVRISELEEFTMM